VEIREEVGEENFFLFGLTAKQVQERQAEGYRPFDSYMWDPELKSAIDLIGSGLFSHGDTELFRPLIDNLLRQDPFMVLADYRSYVDRQAEVDEVWRDAKLWSRMSIRNVARMGKFSSDRSIREYCGRIWKVRATPAEV